MPKSKKTPKDNSATATHKRGDGFEIALSECFQRKEGNRFVLFTKTGEFVDSRPTSWPGVETG